MKQNELLINWLKFRPINGMEALIGLGIYRLAARIHELRQAGYNINTTIHTTNGKHFAVYSMD